MFLKPEFAYFKCSSKRALLFMKGIKKSQLDPCEEHRRGKFTIFLDIVAQGNVPQTCEIPLYFKSGVVVPNNEEEVSIYD